MTDIMNCGGNEITGDVIYLLGVGDSFIEEEIVASANCNEILFWMISHVETLFVVIHSLCINILVSLSKWYSLDLIGRVGLVCFSSCDNIILPIISVEDIMIRTCNQFTTK